MIEAKPKRSWSPPALALALTLPFLALAILPAAAASSAEADLLWLRVEVLKHGDDHAKVKIAVPLSLLQVVLESTDTNSLLEQFDHGHGSLDLARMWQSVRDMEIDEFATVESDTAHVKVWKDRDYFRVDVNEENDHTTVEIRIPLPLMDYMFNPHEDGFDFQKLVDALKDAAPLTLVSVETDEESVKIWVEQH